MVVYFAISHDYRTTLKSVPVVQNSFPNIHLFHRFHSEILFSAMSFCRQLNRISSSAGRFPSPVWLSITSLGASDDTSHKP